MNGSRVQDNQIQIRRARTIGDYEACVAIQREVWNFSNPADYASLPLMRIQDRYGGAVLVADDQDGDILGFAYAMLCRSSDGTYFWWSHMTAVAERFRGTGLGFRIKIAQRDEALREGISEIRWTFDPLQTLNAHFNIRKLGTVAVSYVENAYGGSSSPLHHDLPTDRLEARWELNSDRVEDRLKGTTVILRDFDGIVRVLENQDGSPGQPSLEHEETPVLLEIPVAYPSSAGTTPAEWQASVRRAFQHYFEQGYQATDFILMGEPGPRAFYVLERDGPPPPGATR